MSECMAFSDTVEEFMDQYKVVDTDGVYMSKGSELVPIFRMRQWFEHLPSVQPERKLGKWVYIRAEENGNGLYECSVCGKGDIHAPEVEVPYCWNCGAKMNL